jgi:hypothetical protein
MTAKAREYEFVVPGPINPLDSTTPLHSVVVFLYGDEWIVAYNYEGEVFGGYHYSPNLEGAMYKAQDIMRHLLDYDPMEIDPDTVAAYVRDAF